MDERQLGYPECGQSTILNPCPGTSALALSEIERTLRFTFTPNGRREFVPRDQVFPLFSVYSLLLLHTKK